MSLECSTENWRSVPGTGGDGKSGLEDVGVGAVSGTCTSAGKRESGTALGDGSGERTAAVKGEDMSADTGVESSRLDARSGVVSLGSSGLSGPRLSKIMPTVTIARIPKPSQFNMGLLESCSLGVTRPLSHNLTAVV